MPDEKKKNGIVKGFAKRAAAGLAAAAFSLYGCARSRLTEPQAGEKPEDHIEASGTQYDDALEAEEKARQEAEEKARQEAEEKARQEAEEKARREAEEKERREAEEKARREAEERARQEAEEKARQEAEEKARREAEENARREAEENARREAEEKARREAEENARREAEENARREAEENARREAEENARREAEEKERQEKERLEAERQKGRDVLKDILQKRGFPKEINRYIAIAYNNLEENYDSTYANHRVPKDEYLARFRDAVENNISEVCFYDENDPEAKEKGLSGSVPAIYNSKTQILAVVKIGNDAIMSKILSHEIRHAMDHGFGSMLSASHSAVVKTLIEGSAARGEDFAQTDVEGRPYYLYVSSVGSVFTQQEYRELPNGLGEFMSYQRDENLYEHFECLIGMDKMEEVKAKEGDFFLNLRRELVSQYGVKTGDNVLTAYIKLTKCMDETKLNFKGSEQTQIEVLEGDLPFWQALAAAKDENESESVINSRLEEYAAGKAKNEGYLDMIPTMDLPQEQKEKYLEQAKANVVSYDKFLGIADDLKLHSYEDLNDFANFCIRLEEAEIEALAQKRDGAANAADWAIDFENACSEALAAKTQNISSAQDAQAAKELAAYWYNSVLISVWKNETDVTKENFTDVVAVPLKEAAKGMEPGEEPAAGTAAGTAAAPSEEVGKWHQQVDLRVLGDDF
ncbi:MAG: hypothetical protein IKQ92_05815 [Clostridia bacterium]|nr:hypothetical protein [Clostridia bacterium]